MHSIPGHFHGRTFSRVSRITGYYRLLQAIRENIIRECPVFVDKNRAIALIRENIISEMLRIREKFVSRNFPAIR